MAVYVMFRYDRALIMNHFGLLFFVWSSIVSCYERAWGSEVRFTHGPRVTERKEEGT